MEIGQLQAFLAVVREGSFTHAANRLNLTQPSLSARIQQLEQSLEGELFMREKRPVQLTPVGEIFKDYAERALGILEAGEEAVRSATLGETGHVSVACPFSLATYLMPEVVRRFSKLHDQAELSLVNGPSDFAVEQLLDGLVNLALAAAFPRYLAQAHALLRLHDKMVVTVAPSNPLAQETAVSINQLWQFQPLIIHWGAAFDAYIKSLRQMNNAKGAILSVPLAAALPMAQQTNSVTFLPSRLAAVSKLTILNVPEFSFDWDALVLTRSGRTLTPLEESFVKIIDAVWHQTA